MNRKQKVILAILALADVLVIAGLAAFAVQRSRSRAIVIAPEDASAPSDCVVYLLDSLSLTGGAPKVSRQQNVLLLEVIFAGKGYAQVTSPQIVWTVLDSLSPEFQQLCGVPETVTLSIEVDAEPDRQRFTALLPGDALVSWLRGLLNDDELSERTSYRTATAGPL